MCALPYEINYVQVYNLCLNTIHVILLDLFTFLFITSATEENHEHLPKKGLCLF